MNDYHYLHGDKKYGPFSLKEMQQKGLTIDTTVWKPGLPTWVPITSLNELKDHIKVVPPSPAVSPMPGNKRASFLDTSNDEKSLRLMGILAIVYFGLPLITSFLWGLFYSPIFRLLFGLIYLGVPVMLAIHSKNNNIKVAVFILTGLLLLKRIYYMFFDYGSDFTYFQF